MDGDVNPRESRLLKAIKVLKDLMRRYFYGKIIISMESGNVTNINVSESFKVDG